MSMLTVEECELLTDSKYRSYITHVEKALRNFEYTSEWADLISALAKLNKVLLSHMKYPVIPKKVTIGKRLAQCLHPALPSGVHLKALETYDIIFKCIGTQRLAHDLFIYSAGLFPLLSHAAMSVKPILLTVYERHFVALGRHIKPGLNGLLLGLLPGLEEGAEYYERTNLLLEDFCNAVGPPFFYTGIWECVLSCPSVRLSGTTFLLNHLNKRQSMEDQLHMIGLDIDLMVSSVCACLQDSSVLVQRSMLDFLLMAFPMHNGQLTRADQAKVVEAAVNVVLRRDMSLNRRLYAWLLGTSTTATTATVTVDSSSSARQRADSSSTTSEMDLSYFQTYSKELLVSALKSKLMAVDGPSFSASDVQLGVLKPFRILISLLDKPEIGPVVIENVLLSVFRRLKVEGDLYAKTESSKTSGLSESRLPLETLKTANLLFGSFEPYFIWDFIARMFSSACDQKNTGGETTSGDSGGEVVAITELCQLVEFLLDVIALDVYPETTTEHLPDLLRQVISSLTSACDTITEAEVTTTLQLCSCLLARVQPSMAGHVLEHSLSMDGGDNISVFSNSELSHGLDGFKGKGGPAERKVEEEEVEKTSKPLAEAAGEEKTSGEDVSGSKVENGAEKLKSEEKSAVGENGKENDSLEVSEPVKSEETADTESGISLSHSDSVISQGLSASTGTGTALTSAASDSGVDKSATSPQEPSTSASESTETVVSKNKEGQTTAPPASSAGKPISSQTSINNKLWSGHLSLMQLCVQSFQQFFHRFCHLRILKSEEFCKGRLQHLHRCNGVVTSPQSSSAQNGRTREVKDTSGQRYSVNPLTNKLCLSDDSAEAERAFNQACRLLVDFASFPIYCTDYETVIEQMCSKEEASTLPPWLQDLLLCSCYVESFPVQSSSISTMLDLVILTQSVQTESENKTRSHTHRSHSEGRISVVILPALLPTHLVYINMHTCFYRLVACELWAHLGEKTTDRHQKAVGLFHSLHQVTPNANVCEDVIGRDLISDSETSRIAAFKKFSILWHLTRSLKLEPNPSISPRTFDRSMFVVLDSLKEESGITKTLALTWLTHVIQRGDTSRVLQPLLLMLLHPDTARISIQHVNVHKPKRVSVSEDGEEDLEAKIYAISSEGGNVIYHLSQGKSPGPGRKHLKKSSEDLKSYALTVMNHKSGPSTAPVRTHSVTDLSFERVNPENVKLRINPFGSESSLDKLIFDGYDFPQSASMPNLEGVKRLNSDTCKKEGIFFDGTEVVEDQMDAAEEGRDSSPRTLSSVNESEREELEEIDDEKEEESEQLDRSEESEKDMSSEEIAQWILEGLISSAVLQNGTKNESEASEAETSFIIKSPSSSDVEHVFSSPSLDDLRRADGDSTSGSESGDMKPMLTDSTDGRLAISLSSSYTQGGSTGSLSGGGQDGDMTRLAVDHRDLDPSTDIHELHMHILLYCQKFDYQRTIYALSTIRAMLLSCPRLVVTAMATTSISSVRPPHLAKLQSLLGRHRKSVFGKNFFGDLPPEVMSSYRSNMFVEIVISLCLYFVRGYYPNLMISKLTSEELLGNKMVHILGVEILTLLVSELLSIMKESGKNFVSYISDLLSRCKLQKSLLHCMLASVYNQGRSAPAHNNNTSSNNKNNRQQSAASGGGEGSGSYSRDAVKLTEMIIDFNENSLDPGVNDTFQTKLLQLMLVMIMLEEQIRIARGGGDSSGTEPQRTHLSSSLLNVHYNPSLPVIQQEMFLSAVWSALKQHHQSHLHRHWLGLLTSALPYMGKALSRTVLCVVLQLCRNLDILAADLSRNKPCMQRVPPDHMLSMLEGLTTMCHFCLLDNTSPVSIGQPAPTATNISTETASAGQILTNLIHVFNPVMSGKEPSPARDSAPVSPVLEARARLLSILPRIMACMATLWKAVSVGGEAGEATPSSHPYVGDYKEVRQHILELLSPISLPHGTNLLAAFAVAWNDRRQKTAGASQSKKSLVSVSFCEDQLLLVELVSAIKVLPTDTLIQTVKQVIKQPPPSELNKKGMPLEVNLLQFFYAYVRKTASSSQLADSWPSLLGLLKECLQLNLSPPALFLLLQILQEFVQKTPSMEEKKNQKELQDICQKALESISAIAGSSLEQTTWLRRNFAVKPGPQNEAEDDAEVPEDTEEAAKPEPSKTFIRRSQASDSKYSVQALGFLAELTAPILDVIYSSEEKDRVAPFLTTLLYNVFPYLRHHSSHNLPSYRACSQMLASISGYQYTRRAWRKEAFEMLMEPSFLQMDVRSIAFWRLIIDNLMTHDKTTFKDLMSRVSITQTGSLNLFSSKEQEYEQRSQMVKRLAFTIFCSETDQYQRAMPDIQERLAECLRLPQVPSVLSQVFLCFRVLILRMSPQHLTSLWPTIITEMVQVLLQVEQELSTETDEFNEYLRTRTRTQIQRIAALDSSWAHLGNGLNAHNNPAWLQLYLSVCKLLDMCLVMPADLVPQFQLYRWAFIGTAGEEDYHTVDPGDDPSWRPNPLFTPHIIRLSQLINNKLKKPASLLKSEPGRPLLTLHRLRSLAELQSFFHTVCHITEHGSQGTSMTAPRSDRKVKATLSSGAAAAAASSRAAAEGGDEERVAAMSDREYIEHLLEIDFLEPFN
ncbi:protein dopey-1 [Aplysia californica]|uniref:Protein dopey-1 n=1 Tax=Aplysia californica TaxID=6500 RepID=A0ABM1ACL5_APLCA|nr:protein dopey-1 [Aplysia californica]